MKLGNASMPVQLSGASDIGTFSINMNGKAFRVLSDTLYQNKIGSIVREISCNAYDAHVMSGKKDVPFIVHLPDQFEPWFSVKDQGVGLSDEEIANVFTVYFSSTKDQSNDAIGAFGLGAKTPFAYTDQFTVTSVKNGKKSIYSAFIAESGVPSITKMHEEETEESNGVEINIAVERNDFHNFQKEVETQLAFFTVKPIIENATANFREYMSITTFENEKGKIGTGDRNWDSNIYIVQGNVGYPLIIGNISGKVNDETFAFLNSVIRNQSWKLMLNFNIGEISVTASREGIEYTATTLKSIEEKVKQFVEEFKKVIDTRLSEFETDWDRVAYLNSDRLFSSFYGNALISNEIIGGNTRYYNPRLSEKVKVEYVDEASGKTESYMSERVVFTLNSYSHYKKKFEGLVSVISPEQGDTPLFIIRDKTTYANKKLRHLVDDKLQRLVKNTFLVNIGSDYSIEQVIEKATQHFGSKFNYMLLSSVELPESEKVRMTYARSKRTNFYEMDEVYGFEPSTSVRRGWVRYTDTSLSDFIKEKKKENLEVVYVIVDKSLIKTEISGKRPYTVLLDLCYMKEIFNFCVVAIRENDIDTSLDMKDAETFLKEKTSILENDAKLKKAYVAHELRDTLPDWVKKVGENPTAYESVNDPMFKKYIGLITKIYAYNPDDYEKAQHASRFVMYTSATKTIKHKIFKKVTKTFEEKYPLMVKVLTNHWIFSGISGTMHDHVVKYVNGSYL